ncbi:velvet factor [Chytriomyces sp. MP71]|nr:velvet factor [Chytriomyces sp. MP71]
MASLSTLLLAEDTGSVLATSAIAGEGTQPSSAENARSKPGKLENGIEMAVVQQPIRSRVCGFSVTDRRPVLPPPVIKVNGFFAGENVGALIMMVSLWSPEGVKNVSYSARCNPPFEYKLKTMKTDTGLREYSVAPTNSYTKSLIMMGQLTSVGHSLLDLDGMEGLYFVFPEVAIRSAGQYRMRFDLYKMPSPMEASCGILASVFSNVFQAYPPREFPGIVEPTPLSRKFVKQGVDMRLKD